MLSYSTLQGHVTIHCVWLQGIQSDRGRAGDKGRENENCPPLMRNNPVMPVQSVPVTEVWRGNTLTCMEDSAHVSSQRWAVRDGDSSGWPAWCPLFFNMVRVGFIFNIRLLNMVRNTFWLGEKNIYTTEENCYSITWRFCTYCNIP